MRLGGRLCGVGASADGERGHGVQAVGLARPALEIAVGRRRAALAWFQLVRVHAEAHRAAGVAPVEPGLGEDLIEPLGLSLRADLLSARDDHLVHVRGDPPPLAHQRRGPEVAAPSLGAGSARAPRPPRMLGMPAVRPVPAAAAVGNAVRLVFVRGKVVLLLY